MTFVTVGVYPGVSGGIGRSRSAGRRSNMARRNCPQLSMKYGLAFTSEFGTAPLCYCKYRKLTESKGRFSRPTPPLKWSTLMLCDTHPGGPPSCQRSDASQKRASNLRQVDVHLARGSGLADAIRQIGVRAVTYFRWRREFGGLKTNHIQSPVQFLTFSTM